MSLIEVNSLALFMVPAISVKKVLEASLFIARSTKATHAPTRNGKGDIWTTALATGEPPRKMCVSRDAAHVLT
jgi:hypothetical protein